MNPARARLASAALAVAALLAGCAPAELTQPDVTATQIPAEHRAAVPSPPPDPMPEIVWPLTGLDAAEATAVDRDRVAIAIKIENSYAAKPQTNLDRADVVYETYVEYGISRLIAVYHSDYPESVGPIRSMRPMDHNIVGHYAGPLVFSGAQRRFITAASNAGQDLIAQDLRDGGFFRVNTNYAPHNLHGYPQEFDEQAAVQAPPPAEFQFAYPAEQNSAAQLGQPTEWIDIWMSPYARPEWRWSEDQARWLRFEGDTPHTTFAGVQLWADNVVVLWAPVRYTGAVSGGISVPETLVAGQSGQGWVAADGRFVPVVWSKESRTAPFVLTTQAGEPIYLKPGTTWVELVPSSGTSHRAQVEWK